MHDTDTQKKMNLSSFDQFEGESPARGMNDWVVPWADLMMVMFVLFVVLFIYTSTHKDVRILFSDQSRGEALDTSTLDPLIGLMGQITGRLEPGNGQGIIRKADSKVLYRSRTDGVSVIREGNKRVRVTLRGDLFFEVGGENLNEGSAQYLNEIAELIRLSVGDVYVIGYASEDESQGMNGFSLSSRRAEDVAKTLMEQFGVDSKRMSITARGGGHPEVPGTSVANHARNRRVEIIITNEN